MYEFLCRINPQRDIWMDVDCGVTRVIVRRLFNFAQNLEQFCDVRFGLILEKMRFWLQHKVETNRVCSKIAIISVELLPTLCHTKILPNSYCKNIFNSGAILIRITLRIAPSWPQCWLLLFTCYLDFLQTVLLTGYSSIWVRFCVEPWLFHLYGLM